MTPSYRKLSTEHITCLVALTQADRCTFIVSRQPMASPTRVLIQPSNCQSTLQPIKPVSVAHKCNVHVQACVYGCVSVPWGSQDCTGWGGSKKLSYSFLIHKTCQSHVIYFSLCLSSHCLSCTFAALIPSPPLSLPDSFPHLFPLLAFLSLSQSLAE